MYPAHPAFVATVRQEVVDNVTRMRHHPSLAIYCGNNEVRVASSFFAGICLTANYKDYQMVLQWGGELRLCYEMISDRLIDMQTSRHFQRASYTRRSSRMSWAR